MEDVNFWICRAISIFEFFIPESSDFTSSSSVSTLAFSFVALRSSSPRLSALAIRLSLSVSRTVISFRSWSIRPKDSSKSFCAVARASVFVWRVSESDLISVSLKINNYLNLKFSREIYFCEMKNSKLEFIIGRFFRSDY